MENQPQIRMNSIVGARYAPLVLPKNFNPLNVGYFLKYLPKFNGEGEFTLEEKLVA